MPSTSTNDSRILYLVSTPIGNLQDITLRAIDVLRRVDYVACEDTRVTLKLLNKYEIRKPLISFHSKSGERVINKIVRIVKEGAACAYVTDSGTPVVSDPGCKLVERVIREGCSIVPLPGPSAVHTALAASGISFSDYVFFGFLSNKKTRRRKKLAELRNLHSVFVFFESPHRILDFLEDVKELLGNLYGCIAKEMTKRFENYYRGEVNDLIQMLRRDGIRGEYTIILDNRKP